MATLSRAETAVASMDHDDAQIFRKDVSGKAWAQDSDMAIVNDLVPVAHGSKSLARSF